MSSKTYFGSFYLRVYSKRSGGKYGKGEDDRSDLHDVTIRGFVWWDCAEGMMVICSQFIHRQYGRQNELFRLNPVSRNLPFPECHKCHVY